jgi:hypothetical protein
VGEGEGESGVRVRVRVRVGVRVRVRVNLPPSIFIIGLRKILTKQNYRTHF